MTSVVIVTGAPASGKTTIGTRLAADLHLPYFSKDGFKETLFDTLGWEDRAWSSRLGTASFQLLYHALEAELAAGRSVMMEANFNPAISSGEFRAVQERFPFTPVQVVCTAALELLERRFLERHEAGLRHPGHVDEQVLNETIGALRRNYGPLDVPHSVVIEVDTNDPSSIDYADILRRVRDAIRSD